MDHSWGYGSEQRLREKNEDCYGVFDFPDYTLALVCDGMGGHVGGAYASALAVRTIHDAMRDAGHERTETALERAIQRTNIAIYEAARKNHRLMGMGTTVVAAVITRDRCTLAHVGDSRAYLIRRGVARALTRDHTMVNLFLDAELLSLEDAATHPERHVLSRSLGIERNVEVEVADPVALEPGDVILLCSDGVHAVALEEEIAAMDWSAPHEAVQEILRIVVARGGDDNASAVAVMMGTSIEDVPPTGLPDPRRMDDAVPMSAGRTAVPESEYDPPSPDPMATLPAGALSLAADDTRDLAHVPVPPEPPRGATVTPPPPQWTSPPAGRTPSQPPPPPRWESPADPGLVEPRRAAPGKPAKPHSPSVARRILPMVAASAVLLSIVMCGLVLLMFSDELIAELRDRFAPPPVPVLPEPADTCNDWDRARAFDPNDDNRTLDEMKRVMDGCTRPEVLDPARIDYLNLARKYMLSIGHGINEPPTDAEQSGEVVTLEGKRVPVYDLTPDRIRFLEAVDGVLTHNFTAPTSAAQADLPKLVAEQRPKYLLDTGMLLCLHHHFAEALPRLQELTDKYPGSTEADRASSLLVDCRRPPDDRDADGVVDDLDVCPTIADSDQRDTDKDGIGDACEDNAMVCPTGDFLVRLEPLEAKGRLPRSPQECTQPPPGGAEQQRAIQSARIGQCAVSLNEIQKAMAISPDHCSLYRIAWSCFKSWNLEPLTHRDKPFPTWDDLLLVLSHLNGSRAEHEQREKVDQSLARRPEWHRPATSGLEFQIEAWEESTLMQRYLADLYGEPQVADELGRILYIEAQIAVGLACADPSTRTPVMETAWARRVYVLSRALSGQSGAVLAQHRDDLMPRLRSALALATTPRVTEEGATIPVPAAVRLAYDVGTGNQQLQPVNAPKPKPDPSKLEPMIPEDRDIERHDRAKNRLGDGI